MDFFVDEEIKEIKIEDHVFKYKPVTSGDELDWIDDYMEDVVIKQDGKEVIAKKQNLGKLSLCKLRNIVEVPFDKAKLIQMTGFNKAYKDYIPQEKDVLFRKLQSRIYNQLIKEIDKINNNPSKKE